MMEPRVEDGLVVGTGSDKYQTRNPVARYVIDQLLNTVADFAHAVEPQSILEVGCGEGNITRLLLQRTPARVHATDISQTLVDEAQSTIGDSERARFSQLDVYSLDAEQLSSDLVVCCEVLEHLVDPAEGLRRLARAAKSHAVLSVPREPHFRLLNFLRGQHFSQFGNAPGHVQHWSSRGFIRFVETEFDIVQVKKLLPWTVILASPKRSV